MSSFLLAVPGQGSQSRGMGRQLANRYPQAASVFDEASDVLGIDARELMWDAPANELTRTENAQPAIVILAAAALRAWKEATGNSRIEWAAGHSIGAIGAAIATGALSFGEGVRLARVRGEIMSRAPGDGSMLAVAVSSSRAHEEVDGVADSLGLDVACRNGARQLVLSGPVERIRKAQALLGARSRLLDVSHAFHSHLMDPVLDEWAVQVSRAAFETPHSPFLSSVSGRSLHTAGEIADDLLCGVRATVRWDLVTDIADASRSSAIVLGSGAALARVWRGTSVATRVTVVDDSYRGNSRAE